jgi:putative ABC transport system permease protein
MIRNYLILAFRNLMKRKLFAFINIGGLTIGITSCLLIFLYVQDELKYDKYFTNAGHIYRLYGNNFDGKEFTIGQPARFLPVILAKIPEVKSGVRIRPRTAKIKYEDNNYFDNKFAFADSNIFDFFNWRLLEGNPGTVLSAPYQIAISSSKARLLFGQESPMGKSVNVNNEFDFTITGVFEDIPEHSHIRFDWIASLSTHQTMDPQVLENWGNFGNNIYLELIPGSRSDTVQQKITELWIKTDKDNRLDFSDSIVMGLQPLKEIYLHSAHLRGTENGDYGNIYTIVGMTAISFLILFIACFNYVNLTTAQASQRRTEVGIRKTVGAKTQQLVYQFFTETFLIIILSFIISYDLVIVLMPGYENFIGKDLTYNLLKNPPFVAAIAGIIILTAFLAGAYPSMVLSGYKPIAVLKTSSPAIAFPAGKSRKLFHLNIRTILVIFQYFTGIALIISAILVSRQISFIRKNDTGFNRDQVLVLRNFYDPRMSQHYLLLKEAFLKIPEVQKVSGGINVPTDGVWNYGWPEVLLEEPKQVPSTGYITCDDEYLELLGATIIAGRNFDHELATDTSAVIVNETFVKLLGDTDVLDKTIRHIWDGRDRKIIGVVNDMQYNSMHQASIPCIFINRHPWLPYCNFILVKIHADAVRHTLNKIDAVWNSVNPDWPIDYFFLDDNFNKIYKKEYQVSKLLSLFTLVAVLLCSMGLFGLALFIAQNRTKEIGIHKVHGAMTGNILLMLTKDFITWVFVAFILACPVAYYFIHKWLSGFAYRSDIAWWVFALAGAIAIILAFFTVSWQAYRTARQNPVEALRYE